MNPLVEGDALQEAQLLDVLFDAVRSTAGLLFELRSAMELDQANTGVMILRGVRRLEWQSVRGGGERMAWTVGGSTVAYANGWFSLEMGLWPDAELALAAQSASFVVGEVVGIGAIPDYVEDDERTVRARLPSWQSGFTPVSGVSLGRNQ